MNSGQKVPLKISIVTVSFNQAEFIEDNIRSILDQDYPEFEHIIIDAGSTDGTIDILKKYSHLIWTSEPDNGQSHGLNKGFKKATGEIIGWINSDDLLANGAMYKVAAFFSVNLGVYSVVGDLEIISKEGNLINKLTAFRHDHKAISTLLRGVIQPSTFFRRSG